MDEKIRVFIADDHAVLRAGLRMLLNAEEDMEVVGEASDGQEAITRVGALKPDVVLLDISMPHLSGLEAIHQIQERSPGSRLLILTMHDDGSYLRQGLAEGASGYVLKQAADTELLTAIRSIHQGGMYLHRTHAQRLINPKEKTMPEEPAGNPVIDELSSRELEVLRLIAKGYTNQQAAEQLFLSIKTVETYKARLMHKLGFHTRAELVRYALLNRLMDNE